MLSVRLSILAWMLTAVSAVRGARTIGPMTSVRRKSTATLFMTPKEITPNEGESMEQYRKKLRSALKNPTSGKPGFGGRQLLEVIATKWGVPYDIRIRTSAALGDGSENVYAHIMWSYYGQKSFTMSSKVYMEHLEAVARYISAVGKVELFREKVAECRKRPNAYFGYAVAIPLDTPPSTVAPFFKSLE